uniref:Uncharacterized protein n=1 Tax=Desertifilum tharense IPPAS B-1220 TaxID=1781255 RepID=A0ACD5H060_9CYAN
MKTAVSPHPSSPTPNSQLLIPLISPTLFPINRKGLGSMNETWYIVKDTEGYCQIVPEAPKMWLMTLVSHQPARPEIRLLRKPTRSPNGLV